MCLFPCHFPENTDLLRVLLGVFLLVSLLFYWIDSEAPAVPGQGREEVVICMSTLSVNDCK